MSLRGKSIKFGSYRLAGGSDLITPVSMEDVSAGKRPSGGVVRVKMPLYS